MFFDPLPRNVTTGSASQTSSCQPILPLQLMQSSPCGYYATMAAVLKQHDCRRVSLNAMLPAILGGAVWIVGLVLLRPDNVDAILLFAPLVLVPLGLQLIVQGVPVTPHYRLLRWANWGQLPAALALVASFAFPTGSAAALGWAVPWMIVTGAVALYGAIDLKDRHNWTPPKLTLRIGMIYLAVGGAWLLISRLGLRPLNFPTIIVRLTPVHFHYAGFLLPLLTALAAERLPGRRATLACLGVAAGMPLVAIGMTCSTLAPSLVVVEVIAAVTMVVACLLTASLYLQLAARSTDASALTTRAVSGMSLAAGMLLALIYAAGRLRAVAWIDISDMIPLHGLVNAVGFSLLGLISWWFDE